MKKTALQFKDLSEERLLSMADAGERILECYDVLQKTSDNIVGEILKNQGVFYEMDHYPTGDLYDADTHSQYYYHAHRANEHGHFHTFVREAGIPKGVKPIKQSHADFMDQRDDKLSHLVAISMNRAGYPVSLFTTNRWVTAENWYKADDVINMLDLFSITHAQPSWPVNIWITNMFRLFRPQIENLLRERDENVAKWVKEHPDEDVFEDRGLDFTSTLDISVEDQINSVAAALGG
jgi:hypothetical protein